MRHTGHHGHKMHMGAEVGGVEHAPEVGGEHEAHSMEVFRIRFWVCLVLTIPVLIYTHDIQMWFRFTPPAFPSSGYIPFILGTIIYFYGGSAFLRGAVDELKSRQIGMMTLIAIAITVAFLYSLAVTFGYRGMPLYWELSTLVTVMLLGHWMEMRAVGSARGALSELVKLMPDDAERILESGAEVVPVSELKVGDVVLIRPGGKAPADGEVVQGESHMNEAMITGESRPVPKSPGDEIIAGTVNGEGALRVKVTRTGADTALSRIMSLVETAQHSRSHAQDLADRAAYWLTLIALASGTATFIVWAFIAPTLGFAFERTVTVLVIACPHALGLAIPLVIAISTTLAARNGLLVRERTALEQARRLNTVVFDKTGTLTLGEHGVTGIYTAEGYDESEMLMLMAAVESNSEHALARAVVNSAKERGLEIPEAVGFKALPGRGVEATVDDRTLKVGGPRLIESLSINVPPALARAKEAGQTVIYLVEDDRAAAAVTLADVVRPESYEAVRALKAEGINVIMLTGDSKDVAREVAKELGIDEYYAEILPENKAKLIQQLRARGMRVAMVGDGVNDAPALVTADVGIAIGAGTDVAVEAGSIVLVRNDPRDIVRIIRLSKSSYKKMVENLAWATGYNVIAIPLAAGVAASYGIILPPAVGAILMSASTVIVALNSQLLRRLKL